MFLVYFFVIPLVLLFISSYQLLLSIRTENKIKLKKRINLHNLALFVNKTP